MPSTKTRLERSYSKQHPGSDSLSGNIRQVAGRQRILFSSLSIFRSRYFAFSTKYQQSLPTITEYTWKGMSFVSHITRHNFTTSCEVPSDCMRHQVKWRREDGNGSSNKAFASHYLRVMTVFWDGAPLSLIQGTPPHAPGRKRRTSPADKRAPLREPPHKQVCTIWGFHGGDYEWYKQVVCTSINNLIRSV
jgi:hypothetical protein